MSPSVTLSGMDKDQLEKQYRTHHENRGRYGYLCCHGQRGDFLQKWIGQNKKVLDLGCRDGALTRYFIPKNEVVGVDIDRKALEMAQKELSIQTLWLDLNFQWPFQDESFDVIVACEIMEHLFVLDGFLDRIFSALRPGGLFLGSVPNAFRFKNRMRFLLGQEFEEDPTHVRHFSYYHLKKMLGGPFKNVQIVPLQGKILPLVNVSPIFPLWINRFFAKDLLWRAEKAIANT